MSKNIEDQNNTNSDLDSEKNDTTDLDIEELSKFGEDDLTYEIGGEYENEMLQEEIADLLCLLSNSILNQNDQEATQCLSALEERIDNHQQAWCLDVLLNQDSTPLFLALSKNYIDQNLILNSLDSEDIKIKDFFEEGIEAMADMRLVPPIFYQLFNNSNYREAEFILEIARENQDLLGCIKSYFLDAAREGSVIISFSYMVKIVKPEGYQALQSMLDLFGDDAGVLISASAYEPFCFAAKGDGKVEILKMMLAATNPVQKREMVCYLSELQNPYPAFSLAFRTQDISLLNELLKWLPEDERGIVSDLPANREGFFSKIIDLNLLLEEKPNPNYKESKNDFIIEIMRRSYQAICTSFCGEGGELSKEQRMIAEIKTRSITKYISDNIDGLLNVSNVKQAIIGGELSANRIGRLPPELRIMIVENLVPPSRISVRVFEDIAQNPLSKEGVISLKIANSRVAGVLEEESLTPSAIISSSAIDEVRQTLEMLRR